MKGYRMSELMLDKIESELFDIGLDFKRGRDDFEDIDFITIICGEQHITLSPLWSEPSSGDDPNFFFDSDDIYAALYLYGAKECSVGLFPESEEELVKLVEKIFSDGVDSLEDMS